MKRITRVAMTAVWLVTLAACSKANTGAAAGSTAGLSPDPTSRAALPAVVQLAVGTLRLEEGDLAVDADQAAQLLPLWRAYRSLSRSDSAAPEELQAVLSQIRSAMTADQVRAITEMQMSTEDLARLIEERGVRAGGSGQAAGVRPARTPGAWPGVVGRGEAIRGGAGGPGAGAFPGAGGFMPPGGAGAAAPGTQGATSAGGERAAGAMMATPMVEAVIALLESKL